ncbi:coiled-coil domain-containing protein [uncultured Sunxiuqinia sp.]|uniref:coiled-coil domain-containing protein n=1 Tax=Sunxiuqinia rutila TaxID=1397841 RepID=UPI002605FC44|nr:hypothetical protein [uncultured Sunxiuqinia sp.]
MGDSQMKKNKFSLGSTDKDRRNNLIVIFLAVILVGVVVLFFLQRGEHKEILKALNAEKDSIQMELTEMVQSYDSLKTDNDTVNSQLFVAQTRVKDLMLEIGQVKKASYEQIEMYRNQVGSLRKIMRNYITQVDSLNKRNQELMVENAQVKQEFAQIESQKQRLEKEKERLSQRVEKAAALEAKGLTAFGINSRGNDVNNSRKAEKIQVNFTLGKNITAKRGAKNIYVRIQRPDQILLLKSKNDLFRFEDLRIPYSAMREVTYEGNDLPVNIFWDNNGEQPLIAGEYTVDIFADGNNIGTTTFSFKK